MRTDALTKTWGVLFVLVFFMYLFGPLILMSITAFNSSEFPRVSPWECFTAEWFDVLVNDARLMDGLQNSIFIAFGVVILAVPLGLAGALMLMQVGQRVRPWYYTVVIAPILIPGVVLGISTLIFWERLRVMAGFGVDSFFSNGIFLTIMGQTTFIAAYAMLVFVARLQRFDPALEEASLDLGATHVQTFRKIMLPFLRPAIGSAAVLAFLASFENYNTTIFTSLSESTLTTVLASKVRYGINPSISALAVIIVFLTLVGAVVYEIFKRREELKEKLPEDSPKRKRLEKPLTFDPSFIMVVLVVIAGVATVSVAGTTGVKECKIEVKEEKRRITQERIEALRKKRAEERAKQQQDAEPSDAGQPAAPAPEKGGDYQNLFAPQNLTNEEAPAEQKEAPKNNSGYDSIFNPGNLTSD